MSSPKPSVTVTLRLLDCLTHEKTIPWQCGKFLSRLTVLAASTYALTVMSMRSRFARRILMQMQMTTNELEVSLGPDTGDLGLRIGIHSGPVTAGILRGDKARFQL